MLFELQYSNDHQRSLHVDRHIHFYVLRMSIMHHNRHQSIIFLQKIIIQQVGSKGHCCSFINYFLYHNISILSISKKTPYIDKYQEYSKTIRYFESCTFYFYQWYCSTEKIRTLQRLLPSFVVISLFKTCNHCFLMGSMPSFSKYVFCK